MPRITYQDFDVIFTPGEEKGKYSARVFGEGGDAKITFTLSDILNSQNSPNEIGVDAVAAVTDDNLASRHITFSSSVENRDQLLLARRRPPNSDKAKAIGASLFSNVFK